MKSIVAGSVLLAILILLCCVSTPVEAISSPCTYCKYCSYCDYCGHCPCDPKQQKNCEACKYCTYCKLCSMCDSVCGAGGVADTLANLFPTIASKLGYSVEALQDEEINSDIKNYDIPVKKRDEL